MAVLTPLEPFFAALCASPRPAIDGDPALARAAAHASMASGYLKFCPHADRVTHEQDYNVQVEGGTIAVRLYASMADRRNLPCYVYVHGGAYWMGSVDQFDFVCRAIANDVGCIVVSVGYRLAPEFKFPVAPEDCYAALCWVFENADELGVDRARISIGGESAGGGLAAAVALMARDRGGPALVLQLLELPVTDLTFLNPLERPDEAIRVDIGKARWRDYYLADQVDATHSYASPLLTPDLGGLPPALVVTAEYDALCQEGLRYAERLREAGVPVHYHCLRGQFHGSQHLAALIPVEAAAYHELIVNALHGAFDPIHDADH
jgi:acetyl esterase